MITFLRRRDVERLLDMPTCIGAVEQAFRTRASGGRATSALLGLPTKGGGFHVKAALIELNSTSYFAAKINANFPANPRDRGLPTIQGVLALFDAVSGRPLALMDSIAITTLRTAAATAVAARYLAPAEAESLLLVGCGNQARAHLTALLAVRPVARVFAYDVDSAIAAGFATEMCELHQLSVSAVSDLHAAALSSEMIVTCTPATKAFLEVEDVQQGAFVAAVGADNEHKHEISSALMAAACVVVDDLEQCAAIGDLHHAIKDGAMRQDHVRAELGDVVCDPASGRRASTEIVVFDSTGVAIEDVAAAATVYERAVAEGGGQEISLLD